MKNLVSNFLSKTKNQSIDIGFFFLFLLTFSLSVRKVMLYFPIEGTFNEYTGIYIYLSDSFLTLAIGSWLLVLLYNKRIIQSNIKLWITFLVHRLYLLLPLLLVIWSFISISWSQNQAIATFRSLRLLEFYLLYIYIIFRIVPRLFKISSINIKCSMWNIFSWIVILTAFIQSCLGIVQFIGQKSLGLTFLKESIVSPGIPGVAKIVLDGEKYIRSYGLFPHPNILGGFLVFSIILTILYLRLEHSVPRPSCEGWRRNIATLLRRIKETLRDKIVPKRRVRVEQLSLFASLSNIENNGVEQNLNQNFFSKKCLFTKKRLIRAILLLQILTLLLTFSKSAILGLIVGLVYISYKMFHMEHLEIWKNRTFYNFTNFVKTSLNRLIAIRHYRMVILLCLIFMTLLWIIFRPDLKSLFFQSLNERLFYLNVPRGTFLNNFWFGAGAGQFVLSLPLFYQKVILPWQYQPIHNVFLLIWAELGIVGFGLFIWFIWKLFYTSNNKTVPPRKKLNCSTWNNLVSRGRRGTFSVFTPWINNLGSKDFKQKMYLPENSRGEFIKPAEQGSGNFDCSILDNKFNILSIDTILVYFKGILLGFIFIMLFDHYFWDIQQGSLIFWMVMGVVAGMKKAPRVLEA